MKLPRITENSIVYIKHLRGKPIYFVELQTGESLVIKGEPTAQGDNEDNRVSIVWTNKTMRNVNERLGKVELMEEGEIGVLRLAVYMKLNDNEDARSYSLGKYNWVKMLKVEDLTDTSLLTLDENSGFRNEDREKIKYATKMLLNEQRWYDLGRVVAVDIFNGNFDRFDIAGAWLNDGNIMFVKKRIIGMDTWDPNGYSNLSTGGGFDELNVLTNALRRKEYAKIATESVGNKLSNSLRICQGEDKGREFNITIFPTKWTCSVERLKTLFTVYRDDFERGIMEGAEELRKYLVGKYEKDRRAQERIINMHMQQNPNGQIHQNQPNRVNRRGGMNGNDLLMQQQQQLINQIQQMHQNQPNRANRRGGVNMNIDANMNELFIQERQHMNEFDQVVRKSLPNGVIQRMRYLGWIV